jgi:hypothetical protein
MESCGGEANAIRYSVCEETDWRCWSVCSVPFYNFYWRKRCRYRW